MIVVGDKDMSKKAKVTILAYFLKILYNGPLKWQVASFFTQFLNILQVISSRQYYAPI